MEKASTQTFRHMGSTIIMQLKFSMAPPPRAVPVWLKLIQSKQETQMERCQKKHTTIEHDEIYDGCGGFAPWSLECFSLTLYRFGPIGLRQGHGT
jgi:hypothetical protein